MELQSLADVEVALRPYVALVAELTGADTTLERIRPLMRLLGNPEQRLRIVHLAGTSGKTSTSYFMAALLRAAGQRVGLTVSPHVDSITERVQVNGVPLQEADFCSELQLFLRLIASAEQPPSYFELLYAFALWVFDRRGVDYAVVETGMGGLFDATNVAERPDKLCVLTDIGYDHMHVLGHTLPEIARQKAGIIHSGNVALTYEQPAEVMAVYQEWVQRHAASLRVTHQAELAAQYDLQPGADTQSAMPLYQQRNWLLARYAFDYLQSRDALPGLAADAEAATKTVQVPARMDTRLVDGKKIVMDGAHNQQKLQAFIASFQHRYPGIKPSVLLALKTGKEYQTVSPLLADFAAEIIVTTFDTSQDLPAKSIDPQLLADALRQAGAAQVQVIANQDQAYQALLDRPADVAVITGSFYLLSQLRQAH